MAYHDELVPELPGARPGERLAARRSWPTATWRSSSPPHPGIDFHAIADRRPVRRPARGHPHASRGAAPDRAARPRRGPARRADRRGGWRHEAPHHRRRPLAGRAGHPPGPAPDGGLPGRRLRRRPPERRPRRWPRTSRTSSSSTTCRCPSTPSPACARSRATVPDAQRDAAHAAHGGRVARPGLRGRRPHRPLQGGAPGRAGHAPARDRRTATSCSATSASAPGREAEDVPADRRASWRSSGSPPRATPTGRSPASCG